MPTLLFLKGLPASGKSTYAKELVAKDWVRVNKDDLRAMLNNSKHTNEREMKIIKIRDYIVRLHLEAGKNVVVDDTNFFHQHKTALKALALDCEADFEEKFFDTPLEECILRDAKRQNSVGKKVIKKMYDEYLAKPIEPPVKIDGVPTAVICDIDGTLAHMTNRGPYDTSKYLDDAKDDVVHNIFAELSKNCTRIIVSGRSEEFKADTEKWLKDHGITYDLIYMRKAVDFRNDAIVKREIYEEHIKGQYNIKCVLDDRDRVVKMWREQGLKCLQVAEGDF